ncbi:hypothetical protein BGZ51_002878 [Haplosporangium sp. Z 767]|nr:hypothetical protein BGZ51_002878 [Haplosporangium sp. Z 767]
MFVNDFIKLIASEPIQSKVKTEIGVTDHLADKISALIVPAIKSSKVGMVVEFYEFLDAFLLSRFVTSKQTSNEVMLQGIMELLLDE